MGVEDNGHVQSSTSQARIDCSSQTTLRNIPSGTQTLPSRSPFTQAAFDDLHLRQKPQDEPSVWNRLRQKTACSKRRCWKTVASYIPVLKFIRNYKFKESVMKDIVGGLSVGTIHFPQSLAFSLLASVKLQNGLYTSLWPVLTYVIFGTSAHVSIGTSAVISIMTASIVDKEAKDWVADKHWILNLTQNGTLLDDIPEYLDFKEQAAMSVSLITGAMLIVMSLMRLGFITAYLSESFFAAFTSAAAVHIGTSQISPILGLKVGHFSGAGKLVETYRAIIMEITDTNFAALIIAVVCGICLWLVKDCVNERYKSKLPVPIPIELFVVIGGTLVSYFGNLKEEFGIKVVGTIPTGFSAPFFPMTNAHLSGDHIGGCFVLAMLIFTLTISMAKICAKRHGYEVDDSQEMLAYGLCNFCSSFLRCFPSGVAPPRSMVASSMNVASTLNGLSTFAFMLFFTLLGARWFSELPPAVLAAIIVVALKRLFVQILEFRRYWRTNKFDFVIWFFTFFCTVLLDIDLGLGCGVAVSLITVVFQTQFAQGYKIGITLTDPWPVEHKKYKDSSEVPGIKMFRFRSSLYFANAEIFRKTLYRCTINPRKVLKSLQKMALERKQSMQIMKEFDLDSISRYTSSISSIAQALDLASPYVRPSQAVNYKSGQQDRPFLPSTVLTVDETSRQASPSNPASKTSVASEKLNELPRAPSVLASVKKSKGYFWSKIPFFTTYNNDPIFLDDTGISTKLKDTNSVKQIDEAKESSSSFVASSPKSPGSLFSVNFDSSSTGSREGDELREEDRHRQMLEIEHVIIDCSPINYIDCSGASVLMQIYTDYSHVGIELYLAGCNSALRQTMRLAGVFDKIPEDNLFLGVQDALFFARTRRFRRSKIKGL